MGGVFSDEDARLLAEGRHARLFEKLGAHLTERDGEPGVSFSVWEQDASSASVTGEFNGWSKDRHPLHRAGRSGVWEGFVPGARQGAMYKYYIDSAFHADPFATFAEVAPGSASIVWDVNYDWGDDEWMRTRRAANSPDSPISVYEIDLGSWRRGDRNRCLTYREIGGQLVPYLKEMSFSHVECLPVMEHAFFAPPSRYGAPQDLMWLIDELHRNGIGVILDWAPAQFDGGRTKPRSIMLSSAMFWLEKYHADGLCVALHAWRENGEAISFLQLLNDQVHARYQDVLTMAGGVAAWPRVTGETRSGGLGFDLQWDAGWRHDTLEYLAHDPIVRKNHHRELTSRTTYAFNERYILPLSHEDSERGSGSLLSKIPGDHWQKLATLRLLLAYMFAQPGKKLLFMGTEFGQWTEWDRDAQLDWALSEVEPHAKLRLLIGQLNSLYKFSRALWEREQNPQTFEWIEAADAERNIVSFLRKGRVPEEVILVVCNFSPVPRLNYRLGSPNGGFWKEILNTDAVEYGGSGHGNFGGVDAVPIPLHGRKHSLTVVAPPLAAVMLRRQT